MSKEKKQMVVVGVLLVAVLGIGAFQFLGGGSKPAAATEEEPKTEKKPDVVAAKPEEDPTSEILKRLYGNTAFPRDPFKPQAVLVDDTKPAQWRPQVDMGYQRPTPEISFDNRIEPVDPTQINPDGIKQVPANDNPFGLQGVVIGRNTVAVFKGDDGEFILAGVGDKIAESTYVEGVTEKEVTLRHRGKMRVLALRGGN